MDNKFDNCPYCGRTVIKGAMRCVACGRILQTPEEQLKMIEKLQTKKKFNWSRLLNYAVMIGILWAFYYYSGRIIKIIKIFFKDVIHI
ncbi:MAG: hypothetical protein C4581_02735 [Nitrospiraceae bacterium]|nr:MAG: hypothetical protein C4581_02735 [Nitrospiraceae bacterium]